MIVSYIVVIASAICCIYIVLLQHRTGPTWLMSPPVLMVAYFLLVNMPGILLVQDYDVKEKVLIAHLLWMLGVLASCLIFSERANVPGSSAPVGYYQGSVPTLYIFIISGILAFAATFVLFGRAPLLLAMQSLLGGGEGLTMHEARQMNTLEHRNADTIYFGAGYLKQIYAVVSPICVSALYLHYRLSLRHPPPKFVSLLMVFFVVAGAMNGQIWVSAYIIILFLLIRYLADSMTISDFNSIRTIKSGIFSYVLLLMFVFAYRYLQFLQGRHFQDFYGETLARIYSYPQADLFYLFSEIYDLRYGSTWLDDIAGVLPGSIQSFSYEVNYLIHGEWGFTLSPGMVASAFVNFGYPGVAVTGCILTAIFTKVYNRLIRSRDVLSLALAIYVSFVFFSGLPGDLNSYLVSLLTVLVMYLAYWALTMLTTSREHAVVGSDLKRLPFVPVHSRRS